MEHKVSYFGGRVSGYGWRCSCGKSSGTGALTPGQDPAEDPATPWADAFERTMNAHEHLIAVGQPPRWARSGS